MLLECPSCASRYIIDPRKLGVEGRQVRCASCPNEWFARPEDLLDPPAAQPAAQPAAVAGYLSPDDPYAGLTIAPDPSQVPPPPPPKLDLYAGWGDGAKASEAGEAPPPPPRAARAADGDDEKGEPGADAPSDIDAIFANNTDAPDTSGHSWDAKPEPEPEPPPPPPVRRKPPPPKKPTLQDRALAAARSPAVIGAIGCALVAAVVWQRESVVRVAPSSAKVFAALGMPVNLVHLEFGEVRTSLVREPEGRFLVVEAVIRNPTPALLLVPRIETTLRGPDQRSVYVWTSDPPRSTLRPGEALHFRTRLATPPEEGRDVAVRFAVGGRSAETQR